VTLKFVYRKKHTEFAKWSQKKTKINKNIATWKEVCTKRLLAEYSNKHGPLITVKRLQRKIDDIETVNRQVNLAVEENEKLFEQKIWHNFIIFCWFLCIKCFYNWLRFKVVIDKSCMETTYYGHSIQLTCKANIVTARNWCWLSNMLFWYRTILSLTVHDAEESSQTSAFVTCNLDSWHCQ